MIGDKFNDDAPFPSSPVSFSYLLFSNTGVAEPIWEHPLSPPPNQHFGRVGNIYGAT